MLKDRGLRFCQGGIKECRAVIACPSLGRLTKGPFICFCLRFFFGRGKAEVDGQLILVRVRAEIPFSPDDLINNSQSL